MTITGLKMAKTMGVDHGCSPRPFIGFLSRCWQGQVGNLLRFPLHHDSERNDQEARDYHHHRVYNRDERKDHREELNHRYSDVTTRVVFNELEHVA